MWARWMRLVFVTSKIGHNRAWVYNIRDPLGKVHFKRPGPLAPGEKIKRPGFAVGGGGTPVLVLCLLAMPSMPSIHVFWLVLVVFEIFDPHPSAARGRGCRTSDPQSAPILGGGGGGRRGFPGPPIRRRSGCPVSSSSMVWFLNVCIRFTYSHDTKKNNANNWKNVCGIVCGKIPHKSMF